MKEEQQQPFGAPNFQTPPKLSPMAYAPNMPPRAHQAGLSQFNETTLQSIIESMEHTAMGIRLTSAFSGIRAESIAIVCSKASHQEASLFVDVSPAPQYGKLLARGGATPPPVLSDDFIRSNEGFKQLQEKLTQAGCHISGIGGDCRYTVKLDIRPN